MSQKKMTIKQKVKILKNGKRLVKQFLKLMKFMNHLVEN